MKAVKRFRESFSRARVCKKLPVNGFTGFTAYTDTPKKGD